MLVVGANHRALSRPPSWRQQLNQMGSGNGSTHMSLIGPVVWMSLAVKIDSMKRTAEDIFRDALALPADARAALASRLRESVDPEAVDSSYEQGVAP